MEGGIAVFQIQTESGGIPERPTGAATQFVKRQITHNREAKRSMKRLDTKKKVTGSCECGGDVHEAGVDTSAAAISKTKQTESNDKLVQKYKGFEIHAVTGHDQETVYYAKHRLLGRAGRYSDIDVLKALIDKTAKRLENSPAMVSADNAAADGE